MKQTEMKQSRKTRIPSIFYLALALLTGMLALKGTVATHAAGVILVNSDADTVADDGSCTLREAIAAANSDTASGAMAGECAAGAGPDSITFAADYTITLGSQLPAVTSEMTITGNGATNTIIQADAAPNTATYRVFQVASTGNLTVDGVTIRNGVCPSACGPTGTSGNGGGILNSGGTVTVTNSTITGNSAGNNGGGIYNGRDTTGNGGTVTVTNSTLSGNLVTNGNGGGIYNFGSTSTLTITNSTLSDNTATYNGGAIFSSGTLIVTNSTLSGNDASNGGGIYNFGSTSTLTMTRSLVSGNSATSSSDEVYNNSGTITADAYNVFGHNLQSNADAFFNFAPGGNDFNATSDGGTPVALTSILDTTLADNGGATLTHALVTGSPAIDLAPSAACSGAPINGLDQRGVSRSQDGNVDGTAACDAGAVEFVPTVCGITAATDYNFGGVVINPSILGTELACLRVELVNGNHPHATAPISVGNNALQTERFWRINGFQNDGTTPATNGFTVNLTLPHATADNNSRACKWLGVVSPPTGFGWDCGDDGDNDPSVGNDAVIRTGISSFSDWAVGDNVGPTAVTNLQTDVTPAAGQGWLVGVLVGLLGAATAVFLRRRHS